MRPRKTTVIALVLSTLIKSLSHGNSICEPGSINNPHFQETKAEKLRNLPKYTKMLTDFPVS